MVERLRERAVDVLHRLSREAALHHRRKFRTTGGLRLPTLLEAVTLDDVNAAARRTLDPLRAAVVVAGPYSR